MRLPAASGSRVSASDSAVKVGGMTSAWRPMDSSARAVAGPTTAMRFGLGSMPRRAGALVEGFDGIGAGEGDEVEAGERCEGGIERGEGGGRANLDGGDEDGGRAQGAAGDRPAPRPGAARG